MEPTKSHPEHVAPGGDVVAGETSVGRTWLPVVIVLALLVLSAGLAVLALAGCVSPKAVEITPQANLASGNTVAPVVAPALHWAEEETATSRPATATVGDVSGTSNKVANTALTLAGSGWPLVAVAGMTVVAGVYYMHNRASKKAILAVGQSVKDMGDSPERRALLADVGTNAAVAGVEEHLKSVLADKDLLVKPCGSSSAAQ